MSGAVADEMKRFEQHYASNRSLFERCVALIDRIQLGILRPERIEHVSHRIKDLDKCLLKIEGKYTVRIENGEKAVDLVTDVIGFRVVCLYQDDVERIRERLGAVFAFSESDVTDKIQELEEIKEIFGYRALHILARFNDQRRNLEEYRDFADLKVEFQIRTVTQHAWAAVERTIGYNKKISKAARRRLRLMAALMELADKEFMGIRDVIEEQDKV
ncbi:MAG: hypothetical protein MN733_19805, partial [Nitrososphaera sp.]|nr:hypothetical protein [Nitrososphaera sp.]